MKCETFGEAWLDMELPFPCEIHLCWPRNGSDPARKKVLAVFSEPKLLMASDAWIRENYEQFDLIASYDPNLLDLPNVKYLNFGGCWCDARPVYKAFTVSSLLSTGCGRPELSGYVIRRGVPQALAKSKVPSRLFLSSRRLVLSPEDITSINDFMTNDGLLVARLGDDKMPMFESMFHVAVENSTDSHYFSEKLIDCLRTYTVPIYHGSRAVADIFDPRGIIFVDSVDDIASQLARLTPDDYWSRLNAMHANHEIAAKYLSPTENLRRLILECLPE